MDKAAIPRVHETALRGKLHFLYYPTRQQLQRYHYLALSMQRPPDVPAEPVFVGQVPHLLPVEIIGWVIDTLLKKYSCLWMAKGRKTGCVKAWVTNRSDLEALLEYTRCIMFDLNGIWYVSSNDRELRSVQLAELDDYCIRIKSGHEHVDPRLPKGSIVFELVGHPKLRTAADRSEIQQPTYVVNRFEEEKKVTDIHQDDDDDDPGEMQAVN